MDFLERARAERERLLKKLQAIEESIKILEPAYGEDWEDNEPGPLTSPEMPGPQWGVGAAELGLTDSIRMRLQSYPNRPFSPPELRDLLVATGYDFGQQANPLASIHTVLKRISNGVDPCFVRVEGEKGTLYKFDSDAAEMQDRYRNAAMGAPTQSPPGPNSLAALLYPTGSAPMLRGLKELAGGKPVPPQITTETLMRSEEAKKKK